MVNKKPRGRPAVKRSEDLAKRIRAYIGMGVTASGVARMAGMSEDTLRKLYREELESGVEEANLQVAGMLFEQCKAGNVTAQIFWLKTRARWKESAMLEVQTRELPPVSVDEFAPPTE